MYSKLQTPSPDNNNNKPSPVRLPPTEQSRCSSLSLPSSSVFSVSLPANTTVTNASHLTPLVFATIVSNNASSTHAPLTPASALAQFPTECNAACQPTTDFFFACSAILDPTEGIECMRTLCQVSAELLLPSTVLASTGTHSMDRN